MEACIRTLTTLASEKKGADKKAIERTLGLLSASAPARVPSPPARTKAVSPKKGMTPAQRRDALWAEGVNLEHAKQHRQAGERFVEAANVLSRPTLTRVNIFYEAGTQFKKAGMPTEAAIAFRNSALSAPKGHADSGDAVLTGFREAVRILTSQGREEDANLFIREFEDVYAGHVNEKMAKVQAAMLRKQFKL